MEEVRIPSIATSKVLAQEMREVAKIQAAKEVVKNHHTSRDHGIGADGTSDRQEKYAAFTMFLGGKTIALGSPRMAGGTSQEYLDALKDILGELAELSKAILALALEVEHG